MRVTWHACVIMSILHTSIDAATNLHLGTLVSYLSVHYIFFYFFYQGLFTFIHFLVSLLGHLHSCYNIPPGRVRGEAPPANAFCLHSLDYKKRIS